MTDFDKQEMVSRMKQTNLDINNMRSQVAERKKELLKLQESLPKLQPLNTHLSRSHNKTMIDRIPPSMHSGSAKNLIADLRQ